MQVRHHAGDPGGDPTPVSSLASLAREDDASLFCRAARIYLETRQTGLNPGIDGVLASAPWRELDTRPTLARWLDASRRSFLAGRPDSARDGWEQALVATERAGDLATEVGILVWLGTVLPHLDGQELTDWLERLGLQALDARQLGQVRQFLVDAMSQACRLDPVRGIQTLVACADWTDPEPRGRNTPVWRQRHRLVAEVTQRLLAHLDAHQALRAHAPRIIDLIARLPSPWRTWACMPGHPSFAALGLNPSLPDLMEHVDVLLEAQGLGIWMDTLGEVGTSVLKAAIAADKGDRPGGRSPGALVHRREQVERCLKAYQALIDWAPLDAHGFLDQVLWGHIRHPGQRPLHHHRVPRSGSRFRYARQTRLPRPGLREWAGRSVLILRTARTIAPRSPGEALHLVQRVLGPLAHPGIDLGRELQRRGVYQMVNLLRLTSLALDIESFLDAEQRETLRRLTRPLLAHATAAVDEMDLLGHPEIFESPNLFVHAPDLTRRTLARRQAADPHLERIARLLAPFRQRHEALVMHALTQGAGDRWIPHARAWSRQAMIADVALRLWTKLPAATRALLAHVRHPRVRPVFEAKLVLGSLGHIESLTRLSGVELRHPVLQAVCLGTPPDRRTRSIYSVTPDDEASRNVLDVIDRLEDVSERALAHAWLIKRDDAYSLEALRRFEDCLQEADDDGLIAQLCNRIPLLVGPGFGTQTARVYRSLLRAATRDLSLEASESCPLIFLAIHQLPAEQAMEILGSLVIDPSSDWPSVEWGECLFQRPSRLNPTQWTMLLRTLAETMRPELSPTYTAPPIRFIRELARHDLEAARRLCQRMSPEDRDMAFEAIAPFDLEAALQHARSRNRRPSALPAEALEAYRKLAATTNLERAFAQLLENPPRSGLPTLPLLLALARADFPDFPRWLVEAHVRHQDWNVLLTEGPDLTDGDLEELETYLRSALLVVRPSERFFPRQSDEFIVLYQYLSRYPERGATFADELVGVADHDLRWIILGWIGATHPDRKAAAGHAQRLLASAAATATPLQFDQLLASYVDWLGTEGGWGTWEG